MHSTHTLANMHTHGMSQYITLTHCFFILFVALCVVLFHFVLLHSVSSRLISFTFIPFVHFVCSVYLHRMIRYVLHPFCSVLFHFWTSLNDKSQYRVAHKMTSCAKAFARRNNSRGYKLVTQTRHAFDKWPRCTACTCV